MHSVKLLSLSKTVFDKTTGDIAGLLDTVKQFYMAMTISYKKSVILAIKKNPTLLSKTYKMKI